MICAGFLTELQRKELLARTRQSSGKTGVSRRANAVLLLDRGWGFERVADALFIDDATVREWYGKWVDGQTAALSAFGWKGSSPQLSAEQDEALVKLLSARIFTTTTEIIALVEQRFGLLYSRSGMIRTMARLGFAYRKPKGLPRSASAVAQQRFIDDYEALLNGLEANETVFFADAVHPEHQSRPAHGWIRKGDKVAVLRGTGRKRLNLHGAINLETGACPMVEGDMINAATTLRLLERIVLASPDKKRIHVILDNARYHHAVVVREWLEQQEGRVRLIFLPAYSPNLNPIERLWAVMHKAVTHNTFYQSFADFTEAITAFFAKTLPASWCKIRDKVTDNFHVIHPEKFRVLA